MQNVISTEQFVNSLAPAKELNKLALKNVEKLVKIQINALQEYSKLGLDSWKSALEITDVAGAQAYASKQREVAQEVAKKVAEDAKSVIEMGNAYATEARKVFQDGVAQATKKAA